MKLKLKHLAGYLPYGLQFQFSKHQFNYGETKILTMNGIYLDDKGELDIEFIDDDGDLLFMSKLKPIQPLLRPLSSLTKEIEHGGERFVPIEKLNSIYPNCPNFDAWLHHYQNITLLESKIEWCIARKLQEWHFDIYNLLPNNLAIEIKD